MRKRIDEGMRTGRMRRLRDGRGTAVSALVLTLVCAGSLCLAAGGSVRDVQAQETDAAGTEAAQNVQAQETGTAGTESAQNTQTQETESTQNIAASIETGGQFGDGKLRVMASFYPMADFAARIGGNLVEVKNMVPAGTEPHDWEPTAKDIRNMEDADVFIYNGAGLEYWAEDVLRTLDNRDIIVVEASQGVEFLDAEEEATGKKSSSETGSESSSAKDAEKRTESDFHESTDTKNAEEPTDSDPHGSAAAKGTHSHNHGDADPHVWLDPQNAKIEMKNIKTAFSKADPNNAAIYEKNYQTWAAECDALDREFEEGLSDLKSRSVITAHEAFGYLCHAYGLEQIAVEGLTPDSEPDPARMEEILKFARKNHIKTIFFEELVSPKTARTIADELGAETKVLNPLEGLTDQQIEDGEDYFSIMRANLKTLEEALK